MSEQQSAFFTGGKKMTTEEIKEYFRKKATMGSYDTETQRLKKEIEDFQKEWVEKNINRFLDSEEGKEFIKAHEDLNPDEIFNILMNNSNLGKLYNKALKRKLDHLRGSVL